MSNLLDLIQEDEDWHVIMNNLDSVVSLSQGLSIEVIDTVWKRGSGRFGPNDIWANAWAEVVMVASTILKDSDHDV